MFKSVTLTNGTQPIIFELYTVSTTTKFDTIIFIPVRYGYGTGTIPQIEKPVPKGPTYF